MTIGPFTTYAPPGIYVRTLSEPITGNLLGGLRVPVIIGTAQESLSQDNIEIIRGSSSVADTPIFNEDISGRWITGGSDVNPTFGNQDGSLSRFKVRNNPIVDGNGTGTETFEVSKVSVTVNGDPVTVSVVDGVNGLITLLLPPRATDVILISYFFKRTDTRVTDDVTVQITEGSAILEAPKAETYEVVVDVSDTLEVFVDDSTAISVVVLVAAPSKTAAEIANEVNAAAITGLTASTTIDNQGLVHVQLIATGNITIATGNANGVFGFNAGTTTGRNRNFRTFNTPIVDGSNGGITTTDPTKVTVTISGVAVTVDAVDGANGLVTLTSAPPSGALVEIEYFFNTFQDTFDFLPNNNILEVGAVGIAPGRRDFLNGPDFVVINQGDQSIIQWGTAFQVQAGVTNGAVSFDNTQISGLLVDNRVFGVEATRFTDPVTNQVSNTIWTLSLKPTTGNGRDTPLGLSLFQTVTNGRIDLPTDRPDLVIARVGKNVRDALAKPPVEVVAVDSATNQITLKNPVAADNLVFATFYYSTIADDTYTTTVLIPGPTGVGAYTLFSETQQSNLFQVRFGSKAALPQTVEFPSGSESNPDAIHFGGVPVPETVTVTFATEAATHADFTNGLSEPYDVFSAFSSFADVLIDGASINAGAGVDLATSFAATLLSQPISDPSSLTFASSDRLTIARDGVTSGSIDVSAATSVTEVATAINERTGIDLVNDLKTKYNAHLTQTGVHVADDGANPETVVDATDLTTAVTLANALKASYNTHLTEGGVHANDDTANVVATADATNLASLAALVNEIKADLNLHHVEQLVGAGGNVHLINDTANVVGTPDAAEATSDATSVASVEAYGAEELLKLKSLITPATFQELSQVAIRIPVGAGETDGSGVVSYVPNEETFGFVDSINKPAELIGGAVGTFNLVTSVSDVFAFNVDGTDHSVVFPNNTTSPLSDVVTHINATVASSADTTTATVALVALAIEIQADYEIHIASGVFHSGADVTNVVTVGAPTDLATSISALNEMKTIFNAHRVLGSAHPVLDNTNVVLSPEAVDLATTIVLASELKAKFNSHLERAEAAGNVHAVDDTANDVTSPNVVFATPVAYVGTSQHEGNLVLRSFVNTVSSFITVQTGNSNSELGFANNTTRFRIQPSAASIASALNADAGMIASAAAYSITQVGLGNFLNIRSLTAGATSTISFASFATSIFFDDTGIGIEPGVSGDSGEATQSGFDVTSSDSVNGSSGSGFPGQTYTDDRTGLRFTILAASAGDYADAGSFTYAVSSTFLVDSSIPTRSVPGLELTILNTLDMGVGTTSLVQTFRRTGAEPAVGDVFNVSYKHAKTDLSTALFRDFKKIQQNFGAPTPTNPLSLAARLALLNGSVLVALRQVLRAPGQGQATPASYTGAINEQKKPLAGNIKPDVLVPLTTDTSVFTFLNQHCIFMGSPRQEGERIGVVGTAVGTTPLGAQAVGQALQSELMVVMYPDSFVVTVTDEQGNQVDQVIDGSFAAAAMAGSATAPSLDVATPWTRRVLQGFNRIGRILDPTEANQTAVAGITVIEQVDVGLRIRQGLTTNLRTVITRTPSVITTIHFVQQTMRAVLDPFIGQKFTGAVLKSVEDSMRGAFQNLIDSEIVATVAEINAQVDEVDPTILRSEAIYVPIFPLEYIITSLSVRIRI